jgi:hypothetical protein
VDHAFGAGVTSVGGPGPGHIDVAHPSGGDIRSAVDPSHLAHDGGAHDPLGHGGIPGGVHDPFAHDAGLGATHEPSIPGVHDPIGHDPIGHDAIGHDAGPAHDALDHHGF